MARQLSNLIVPSLFGRTILEESLNRNSFTASGVIPISPVMSSYMAGPGSIFTLPSLINPDMTGVVANVPTSDSSVDAVPEVITGRGQKFVKNARNRTFNVNGLVQNIAGVDPLAAIVNTATAMINTWRQQSLLAQLSALLDPTNGAAKENVTNIALETVTGQGAGNKLITNPTATITAALGKAWGDVGIGDTLLIMHSDTYLALVATNTTTFLAPSIQNPQFKSYLGYPVLVDDTIGKRAGTTDGTVYTVYAIKRGGVEFGVAADETPFEVQERPLQGNGAGGEIAVVRDIFGFHVPGVSFTGSIAGDIPTDTELATVNKWTKVFNHKSIGVAAILFN